MGMHGKIKLHDGLIDPGSGSPSKDCDVFMKPLIKELMDLWKGVDALDVVSHKKV
jgi:hypothetical protein